MNEQGALRAVVWDRSGTVTDLNARLPADSGWTLVEVNGVDAQGDLIGIGIVDGERRQWKARIEP